MASADASSIYIRMPADLKHAVDDHAKTRGSTVTAAAVDLLSRGLQAVADEQSVADLHAALASTVTEKAIVEAELVTARAQLATLGNFVDRASQRVGTCPKCRKPISGADVFAASRCPSCDEPLTELLVPKASGTAGIDQRELLLFAGALGALIGVALMSTKK
jgi:hypothetical protein